MRFLALNTIGLTGAEVVAAELARSPEVLMLPGQNFIAFGTRTYRAHDYEGHDPGEVFANLSRHQYTRTGRCWAGLTKSMSPDMRAAYDAERHRAEFLALAPEARTTIDHFRNYALAYARAAGSPSGGCRYFGVFGHNIVVNASHYPDFVDRAAVVDVTNPVDLWLANIGQRMAWDNLGAIRVWLVGALFCQRWAARHPGLLHAVDLRDFARDRAAAGQRLVRFLGLDRALSGPVPDGFVVYDPGQVESLERNASNLRRIYEGWAEFSLALSLDEWADGLLRDPEIDRLLDRHARFWNSSSHTNLDWVGPVGDEIVERALAFTGARSRRNLSRWFYHDCFRLHSDDWENPSGTLEHYLGDLEEEIVLPAMSAYARIVLCYLERVADNIVKRAYSATPIRSTDLYRRVMALQPSFGAWALVEKVADVERRIDAADTAIARFC